MMQPENKPVAIAKSMAAPSNPLAEPCPAQAVVAAPAVETAAEQTLTASVRPSPAAVDGAPLVSKPAPEQLDSPSATASSSAFPATPHSAVNLMMNPTFKGFDDFTAFGQANLDALVQASAVFTKGVEEFSKEMASLARTSLDTSAAATRAAFAAKTVKDVVEVQTDFTRTSLETLLANWARFGELGVRLATDTASPLAARANAVAAIVAPSAR